MGRLSPHLDAPLHLDPYITELESALGASLNVVFHAPPQHGKTEATKHGFISWAIKRPGLRHAYSTYNQDRSNEVSDDVKALAFEAGLGPTGNKKLLKFDGGTAIKFTSVGGSLTGAPIDGVHVIDDPVKDREEAESPRFRDRAYNWITDVAQTRRHPGSSCILMMTRWHHDDLAGRCIKRMGWRYIRLPAVCDGPKDPLGRKVGEALWEARRPLSFLKDFQVNAFTWSALYQGQPKPRGQAVFRDPAFWQKLPDNFRPGYGADLAYTEKTQADWSIAFRMYRNENLYYIVKGLRRQLPAPEFCAQLKRMHKEQPGPMLWYGSGTEKGVSQFIRKNIPALRFKQVTTDKFIRAQDVAAAYNDGRVLWPAKDDGAGWIDEAIEVVSNFTGVKDPQDDDVDALAAGFDVLSQPTAKYESKYDSYLPDLRI